MLDVVVTDTLLLILGRAELVVVFDTLCVRVGVCVGHTERLPRGL